MKPKTAFFLGAVSAKLDFLREDLVAQIAPGSIPVLVTDKELENLIVSVDKIRGLVSKIYDVENAEEENSD